MAADQVLKRFARQIRKEDAISNSGTAVTRAEAAVTLQEGTALHGLYSWYRHAPVEFDPASLSD